MFVLSLLIENAEITMVSAMLVIELIISRCLEWLIREFFHVFHISLPSFEVIIKRFEIIFILHRGFRLSS